MSKKLLPVIILSVVLLLSVSCSKKPAAVVNGKEITMEAFNRQLKLRKESAKAGGAGIEEKNLKGIVIDELIGYELLIQGAKEKKISVNKEEINKEIDSIKQLLGEERFNSSLKKLGITLEELKKEVGERLLINQLLTSMVPEDSIKEEDVKDYYMNSKIPFMKPERVLVKLIQVPTREEGEKILKEIKEDKIDFDTVGERFKKEKTAVVSEYGWARSDLFTGTIADALKELKKGEVGGPYKGKDGFYLLRVKDRKPSSVMSFEEAKDQIRSMLLDQKRQAVTAKYIAEQKKKADIKVYVR